MHITQSSRLHILYIFKFRNDSNSQKRSCKHQTYNQYELIFIYIFNIKSCVQGSFQLSVLNSNVSMAVSFFFWVWLSTRFLGEKHGDAPALQEGAFVSVILSERWCHQLCKLTTNGPFAHSLSVVHSLILFLAVFRTLCFMFQCCVILFRAFVIIIVAVAVVV